MWFGQVREGNIRNPISAEGGYAWTFGKIILDARTSKPLTVSLKYNSLSLTCYFVPPPYSSLPPVGCTVYAHLNPGTPP
jgi:hypothetical protein